MHGSNDTRAGLVSPPWQVCRRRRPGKDQGTSNSIDLSVVVAILSSNINTPIPSGICFAAEIGLSGELRNISKIDQRISEAEKLGFKYLITSSETKISLKPEKLKILQYSNIENLLKELFKVQD